MNKYGIDKSFGPASKFRVHLNRSLIYLAGQGMKNMDKCLKKRDDIAVDTEKICVGNGSIDIHIITPRECGRNLPCLFYIHGGGFVFDAAPYHYKNAADYAVRTGSAVVFPRYRLVPKVTEPSPVNDCTAAWRWVTVHADRYKIDTDKIGIGGDSAGGYLAARLTNRVLEKGGKVLYQLLIYPVTDSGMKTESMKRYTDTPMWNARSNKLMWRWYYGGKQRKSLIDEPLPPGIPPTYIETAEFDCLHDEGLLYAEKLKKAGTDVTVYETYKTMHGFDIVDCDITKAALSSRIRFINRQLNRE